MTATNYDNSKELQGILPEPEYKRHDLVYYNDDLHLVIEVGGGILHLVSGDKNMATANWAKTCNCIPAHNFTELVKIINS